MNRHPLPLGIISLIIWALSAACQGTMTLTSIPVESPSADPSLTILNAVTSRRVGGDYAPLDVTSQFSPNDNFYCVIRVADVERDAQIIARWHFGDALISETTYTTEEQGSGYVAFELTNQQPWPAGVYRVDILSAGIIMDSLQFRVTESPSD